MSGYTEAILYAFLFFPFISFLFTIPYVIWCYRKYGTILSIRVLIVYSFILYLMCVYFLVILPLPNPVVVMQKGSYTAQLIPFHFIKDIIKDAKTYSFFKNRALWQCLFNIIMTIPFGVYLHYHFTFRFKKTLVYAFALSLFFELTQLSGLYFIYRFNYRLFDVDDLLFNTFGALIGYWAVTPFFHLLPSRSSIDEKDKQKGRYVSFTRRVCAYATDFMIASIITYLIEVIFLLLFKKNVELSYTVMRFLYLVLISMIRDGETWGMSLFKIDMDARDSDTLTPVMIITHYAVLFAAFDLIPFVLLQISSLLEHNDVIQLIFAIALHVIVLFWKLVMAIYVYLSMRNDHTTFYDEISNTMIISCIDGKHPLPSQDEDN